MDEAAQLSVACEFEGSVVGDQRRLKRLMQMASAMSDDPSASIPAATKTTAALEAAYRFLGNEAVSMDGILEGHIQQTVARASLEAVTLAVHDTTVFKFEGQREGLGPVPGGRGFLGNFTLLVTPGEARTPLGVIALQKWTREEDRRKQRNKKKKQKKQLKSGQSFEAARWKQGVALAEQRVDGCSSLIHVMDRDGDSYDLWAQLQADNHRFVIRNSRNRKVADGSSLVESVAGAKVVVEREVVVSRRAKSKIPDERKQAQPRERRLARLAVSGQAVTIKRPVNCLKTLPSTLKINFVHVRELGTNGTDDPVDWMLGTTEPIETAEEIERVVDTYRSRWVIEDYFKALKTGCDYQNRQLESEQTLSNALAIFVPIAWRLLLLRSLSRSSEDTPASEVLTDTQIKILVAEAKGKLPRMPTVRQALLAVAGLGGHIKNNGEPGWLVLGRGFQYLLILERGWNSAQRSDQ
jgi:hypothetical protein